MRLGELLALRWEDVDLKAGSLQVLGTLYRSPDGLTIGQPKTAASRRPVVLGETAIDALGRDRRDQSAERLVGGASWGETSLVFANEVGRPIEASNLRRRSFEPLLTKAGLPRIRFHDLRHSSATLLLSQGLFPKVVSERLGHGRVGITLDVYGHVTPSMQREAADLMESPLRA